MLRTALWAVAGAIGGFAAAFTLIALLLGGELCGPTPDGTECSAALGIGAIAGAPVGAILLGWFSRVEKPLRSMQAVRFGRTAAPDGRGKAAEPEGRDA